MRPAHLARVGLILNVDRFVLSSEPHAEGHFFAGSVVGPMSSQM
jgi:hypothetical protein